MQPVWRNFAPMYIQGLSHSHLFAGDTVFVSGDAPLSARDPQPLHWHDAYEFGFVMSGTGAILENIRTEVMHYQPLWDVAVCGQVLHAVGLLAREALRAGRPTPEELARRRALKIVQPVLALLHERYTEALSLDDLASAAGLSPSYCCELF